MFRFSKASQFAVPVTVYIIRQGNNGPVFGRRIAGDSGLSADYLLK